jgi:hypothetical protein
MKTYKIFTLLAVCVLLFATAGVAFAEEESPPCDPATDPTCTTEPEEGDGWVHPIVALLGAYLDYQQSLQEPEPTCDPATDPTCTTEPTCDPATDPTCTPPCDPATDPTCTVEEPPSFEDEIAALHEEGVGFGVLVKLLSLSNKGDASLSDLVNEWKTGHSFKDLYDEYGNPTKLGVGHVKQELKCVENGGEDCAAKNDHSSHGNGKDNNPGKGHNK